MSNVVVNGGLDDLQCRHVRFLQDAAHLGALHILLWTDESLRRRTGAAPKFPEAERLYFVRAVRYVRDASLVEAPTDLDALHAQHRSCAQIVQAGGDYLFIVKGNQPTLQADIQLLFAEPKASGPMRFAQQAHPHTDHTEVRQLWASDVLGAYLRQELGWVGAQQVRKVRRQVLMEPGRCFPYARTLSLIIERACQNHCARLTETHYLKYNTHEFIWRDRAAAG